MFFIETKRLKLRPFEESDYQDIADIYTDDTICQFLLHDPWKPAEAKNHFLNKLNNCTLANNQPLNLAVVYENKTIGDLSIWYTEMKDTLEIGYVFNAEVKGLGLATEAVEAVITHCFDALNIHRIQANLDARNMASARVCERIGMRKEAHFIKDYWNKGEWTDSLIYGMLKTDLKN